MSNSEILKLFISLKEDEYGKPRQNIVSHADDKLTRQLADSGQNSNLRAENPAVLDMFHERDSNDKTTTLIQGAKLVRENPLTKNKIY